MPKLAFSTDRQLRAAKPRATDYRIGCGGRLYLRITPTGFKYWQVRFYQSNGKESLHQFASYPQTSLLEAKAQVAALLPALLAGRPAPAVVARQIARAALSFDECAARFIEAKRHEWKNAKHAQQWKNTLSQHASPVFGTQPIGAVTRDDVLRCLEPIWLIRNETASRLRGRIESVMDWAKAKGLFIGDNPASWKGGLQNLLAAPSKTQRVTNHPSMPYADLPDFFMKLQSMPGVGALALRFLILTACRTSEVLGATWAEMSKLPEIKDARAPKVEIEKNARNGGGVETIKNVAIWTIPKERMKAGREHRVPLSGAAVHLLEECRRAGPYIFSNSIAGDKAMSNMALAMLLRRADVAHVTVHGFRSTFRNWAAEQTSYPREVCEHALAHQLPDKVEAAYLRSDLLDKRRALMQDWARFCLGAHSDGGEDGQGGGSATAGSDRAGLANSVGLLINKLSGKAAFNSASMTCVSAA